MAEMHAAVVTSFDEPPHYQASDVPTPNNEDEALVDVLAVGLHPRVRTDASGKHYTSTGALPMIPGVDGVGRTADGRRVYFVADDEFPGSMAEKAVIDMRRTVLLADDADVNKIAAAMNPAMSSWVALRRRVPIETGQHVLVLGATGNAGAMAVQVAKRLGEVAWSVPVATSTVCRPSTASALTTSCSSPTTETPPARRSPGPPPRSTSSSTTSGADLPSRRSWPC